MAAMAVHTTVPAAYSRKAPSGTAPVTIRVARATNLTGFWRAYCTASPKVRLLVSSAEAVEDMIAVAAVEKSRKVALR